MKKKIAILLAAVMTAAALPMNAMASSSNSVTRTVTVAVNKEVKDVYLNITPNDEISSGNTIAVTVEGAEFFEEKNPDGSGGTSIDGDKKDFNDPKYAYGLKDVDEFKNWDAAMSYLKESVSAYVNPATGEIISQTSYNSKMNEVISKLLETTNELPYKLKRTGAKEMQVELYPLTSNSVGRKMSNNDTKIYYHIPLMLKATSTGDIKVTVDSNETSISGGGTYTVGTVTSSSGSTTTTVEEIKSFDDNGKIKAITIKENVAESFEPGKEITVRLNSGFKFNKDAGEFAIKAGINADSQGFDADLLNVKWASGSDCDEFTFKVPFAKKTEKASAIRIEGLEVQPIDDDDDWGEVKLTVSGGGVSKETIVIGERKDFGFAMTVLEDVPTILAGRFEGTVPSKVYDDDCVSAQFKFEETIPNTWLTQRKLEFSVPEGVQIFKYDFDDDEQFAQQPKFEYANDYRTLRIAKDPNLLIGGATTNDCAEFKLKLYLSADADYEGEVTVSVKGGGLAEGDIDDIVVANVICPVSISSSTTKSNMGYQSVDTADITITEAQEGVFLKNGWVYIGLDASYGLNEVGFANEGIDYEIDGELEITNFDVGKVDNVEGVIKFKIDKESYTEPSSITIKNVKVGTTRSVPYGSYDLKVEGDAIITNYHPDGVDHKEHKSDEGCGYNDGTSNYIFEDYFTVGTVTGTFDDVVKVTIDEKTILINDQAQDMDVAPYIQASSNSTMVPLRFVAVALGVDPASISNPDASSKVAWDANTKTVTIYYGAGTGQKIVQFTAGSNYMTVDGSAIPMDYGVVAEIKDDRMFVPFRALGQALGVNVTWDADTRTATYNG